MGPVRERAISEIKNIRQRMWNGRLKRVYGELNRARNPLHERLLETAGASAPGARAGRQGPGLAGKGGFLNQPGEKIPRERVRLQVISSFGYVTWKRSQSYGKECCVIRRCERPVRRAQSPGKKRPSKDGQEGSTGHRIQISWASITREQYS